MTTSTNRSKKRICPYTLDQHSAESLNPTLKKTKQTEGMDFFVSKKSVSKIKITLASIGKLSKEKEDPKEPLNLLNKEAFHGKTATATVTAIARAGESNCPQNLTLRKSIL